MGESESVKSRCRLLAGVLICLALGLFLGGCDRSPKSVVQRDDSGFIPDHPQGKAEDDFGFVPDLIQPHKHSLWDKVQDFKDSLSAMVFGEKQDMGPVWENYFRWQKRASSQRFPEPRPLNSYSPEDQKPFLKKIAERKAKEAKMSETEKLLIKTYSKIEDMNREMGDMRSEMAQMRETIKEQADALDQGPSEPRYITQYKKEMAEIERFNREMDRGFREIESTRQQTRPNLSGFYYTVPMTGPNTGNLQINYLNGPQ